MNVLRKVVSRDATVVIRLQRKGLPSHGYFTAFGARSSTLQDGGTGLYKEEIPGHPHNTGRRRWFSTKENVGAPSITSTTSSQPDHDAIIRDSNRLIQASALQGDAIGAQKVLDELESLILTTTTATTPDESHDALLEARIAVLDAWIAHQTNLFQQWQSLSSCTEEDQKQQQQLKATIVQAAQQAHKVLEQTVPFLAQPAVAIYMQYSQQQQNPPRGNKSKNDASSFDETTILEDPQGVLGKRQTTNLQVQMHRCNAVLKAWARASQVSKKRQGIPQRAQYLVQRMEASKAEDSSRRPTTAAGAAAAPTVESYNSVLEAWAWSSEHLRATMAEQIFQFMSSSTANNRTRKKQIRPNGDSYKWIIRAWCNSRQNNAASKATEHLMKWLQRIEKGHEEIEPTVETYQMVMKAWALARDRKAPFRALGILRRMEHAHDKSYCSVAPDETCYKYYLMASARKSLVPEQGPLAQQILTKLKNQQIIPDQDCYTAVIQIWKNSARNPLFGENREQAIVQAVESLQELSLAHHRSSLVSVKPTTNNYNDVLVALVQSRKAVSKTIAETLVQVMEDSNDATDSESEIQPNAETYQWLLFVYAKSRATDKLQGAKQVLERMKGTSFAEKEAAAAKEVTSSTTTTTNNNDNPIVGVYNAFLRVCESMTKTHDNETEILQSALGAVEEMRSLYGLKPNSQTYANLLNVCKWHLEVGTERSRIVQSIFDGCCEEGLVDARVLKSLKAATSDEQYFQLVLAVSEGVDGTRMVPEEWSSNVRVQRRVTASGRKAAPLSVDGRFTVTKAMKEYRMRKLRSKANQRVLQGGRLKLDPKKRGEAIRIELDEEALSK